MKKLYLSLLVAILAVATSFARVVIVDSPANLPTLYSSAVDGDTLMLYTGVYTTTLQLPAGKSITVMAADTSKAEYKAELNSTAGTTVEGGSLVFDNIIIDRDNAYFMGLNAAGRFKYLAFKNCIIRDLTRSFLRTTVPDSSVLKSGIDKFEMYNCVMYNCNTNNWNMMWTQIPINNIDIQQCTFYKNDGVESFFTPRTTGGKSYSSETLTFIFKNNIVYQGARDANRAICNATNQYGEESTFTFENNIIVCPEGKTAGALVRAEIGMLTMNNNLVHNYTYPVINVTLAADSANNYNLAKFGFTSPSQVFPDPTNGEFTMYSISPLATSAKDGGALGPQKWLKEATNLVNLTVGYAPGSDELSGTISGPSGKIEANKEVTLVATHKFGYRFVAWKDAQGANLSESASYTFVADADKAVYAAFKQINTYKLALTVDGLVGKINISVAGKDGGYEIYEEGTEITLSAESNPISEFLFWGDFDSSPAKTFIMNSDMNITATFATRSFVCGWNFDTNRSTLSQSRPADFVGKFIAQENAPLLVMYSSADPSTPYSGWWNRTQDDRTSATFWKNRTSPDQYYYYESRISTVGYKDIKVQYALRGSYYGNDVWKLMYSFNGISFEEAGRDTVSTSSFSERVHTIANSGDKQEIYLRWTPDPTSTTHGDIVNVDGTYIADLYILADESGTVGVQSAKSEKPMALINNGILTLKNIKSKSSASIRSLDGRVVRSFQAIDGVSVDCTSLKGVYLLQVSDKVVKVAF